MTRSFRFALALATLALVPTVTVAGPTVAPGVPITRPAGQVDKMMPDRSVAVCALGFTPSPEKISPSPTEAILYSCTSRKLVCTAGLHGPNSIADIKLEGGRLVYQCGRPTVPK